jgi:uncharacterized caspase-like protein
MDFLKTKINEFERKIDKLKSLEKELDSLDTEGFESEVNVIKSKLKSPDKIPEIEKEIKELNVKIERRIPDLSLKRTTIVAPAPKNAYAVIIGINKYEDNDIPSLKYARNDAIEIYKILTDPNYGIFSEKNVKLLLDEQATLLDIKSAMGTFLARNAQKEDMVYIFFAGHGSPELDPTGKADDNFEKYIVPYDAKKYDLFSSGLSMEDIKTIFQRIKSNRVIFFIDSCYSGEAGGRTFSRPGFQTKDLAMSDRFLEELSAEGRIIFAASKPDELSLEIDELQHGLFTYYLAEGLKGKADLDDDGVVTIDELINYVSENVPRKAQQLGGRQHPLRKGESAGKIPLTFCETEIKRQIRELNSDAAESFEKRDYETAIKKWNEVIRRENDNSKALNGIKEANKKIGEKIAILKKKQSILIRLHGKGLPTKEFDEAMTLLKKDTSIYTEKEKKICKYVEEMLGDNLCIETYLDTRKLIENNTD